MKIYWNISKNTKKHKIKITINKDEMSNCDPDYDYIHSITVENE